MSTIRTEYRTLLDIYMNNMRRAVLVPGLGSVLVTGHLLTLSVVTCSPYLWSPVNPICARGSSTGTDCLYTPELSMLKSHQFNQRTMCNQHLTEHFPFKGRGTFIKIKLLDTFVAFY